MSGQGDWDQEVRRIAAGVEDLTSDLNLLMGEHDYEDETAWRAMSSAADAVQSLLDVELPVDDNRTCGRCGDTVQYLSTDDMCDGCCASNDSRAVL